MENEINPIFDTAITHVAISNDFIEICKLNGFKNLNDIIKIPVKELLTKPEFNYRILTELYSILKSHHLEKCLIE
jgi:hypothetical protein